VRASGDTRIVKIVCDSTDPGIAAQFANTLADEFVQQSLESRWNATQRIEEWLSRQLEDLLIKLEKSEEKLQRYARASGLMFTSEQHSVAEERLRQLQVALSEAGADRAAKQSRYELGTTSSPESLPEILDHGPLRDYQLKLTDLRRQLAELRSTYTDSHYKVLQVRAQLQELETAMKNERSHIVERIRNEYDSAVRRESLIEGDYANQAELVAQQAGKSIQYNIYKREVDTNRQIYENLLQKVKEAGVASAMKVNNVRLVDPALSPEAPYRPNHPLNTAVGLLFGIFFGVASVIVRERMNHTFKQPGDVAACLKVSELGVVPASSAESSQEAARRSNRAIKVRLRNGASNSAADLQLKGVRAATDCVELVTWHQKSSFQAECFRATPPRARPPW